MLHYAAPAFGGREQETDVNYQAILFDLDGTLVDSAKLIYGAFNHVAEKYLGRRYTPEEITPFFGPSEDSTWAKLLSPDQLEGALKAYYSYYRRNHDEVILYEGIPRLLKRLGERRVPLAIVTGRGKRTTEITLELCRLGPFFQEVVTSDDLTHPKPHPQCVLEACRRLGVQPAQALMVGDSRLDIQAGRSAGAVTAAALWGTFGLNASLEQAQADYGFQSPNHLESFLFDR